LVSEKQAKDRVDNGKAPPKEARGARVGREPKLNMRQEGSEVLSRRGSEVLSLDSWEGTVLAELRQNHSDATVRTFEARQ
jgi:hypothetical protein